MQSCIISRTRIVQNQVESDFVASANLRDRSGPCHCQVGNHYVLAAARVDVGMSLMI